MSWMQAEEHRWFMAATEPRHRVPWSASGPVPSPQAATTDEPTREEPAVRFSLHSMMRSSVAPSSTSLHRVIHSQNQANRPGHDAGQHRPPDKFTKLILQTNVSRYNSGEEAMLTM